MSRRKGRTQSSPARAGFRPRDRRAIVVSVLFLILILSGAGWVWLELRPQRNSTGVGSGPSIYRPRKAGSLSYHGEIASLIERRCVACHRPGQPGPFPLLTYGDVRKRTGDIARVTAERVMPPWLPEPGLVTYVGERRLTDDELGMLQQWIQEGATEGAPLASSASLTNGASSAATRPTAASALSGAGTQTVDWVLGPPDLVVTLPQPYLLPAEGKDVYRNFVIPVPLSSRRYVRGVELRPGHPRAVHHAFLKVDTTGASRRADAADLEPGFGGMNPTASTPGGQFLGWQPGRQPALAPDGLAWLLEPGTDLVLEMHLNPSGKPESVQPSVGLYFTDRPPTNACFKVYLTSYTFEIPAGATDLAVEDEYVLPVDVQALAVLPHAHYLGKDLSAWAELPNGRRLNLLHIPRWDFNWQGDYRFAEPTELPAGSRLRMRFTYDNSTNNVRNPHHPPRMVRYGPQSEDEMAELWLQVLPRRVADRDVLARDFGQRMARKFEEHDRFDVLRHPENPRFHTELAMLLLSLSRWDEAAAEFRAAMEVAKGTGGYAPAHYGLGLVLRHQERRAEAVTEFESALRLDPKDSRSHGNLGFIYLDQGDAVRAAQYFETALQLDPSDAMARAGLEEARKISPKR